MPLLSPLRTAAALAALLACHAAAPAADTYIGVLPGEPAGRVAVVVEGKTFLAYACGKTDEFNQANSAWFKGTIENGRIDAAADGKSLKASLDGGVIRGSVSGDGDHDREFTAKPVPRTAVAGLYRATREINGDALVLGWIVDAKHQVVGGCRGSKSKPIALQPAKPLPPPPPVPAEPPPAVQQQAEELLVQQFEEEPDVAVQGEKVTSVSKPPAGKVVAAGKKK